LNCQYEFPAPYWDNVSDEAKDLIHRILVKDPKERLKADEILQHPWMTGESTPQKELDEVANKIKEYNAKTRFRKAGQAIIALTRLNKMLALKS